MTSVAAWNAIEPFLSYIIEPASPWIYLYVTSFSNHNPTSDTMSTKPTTKAEKNLELVISILKQVDISGRTIDWQLVANDLGLEQASAANLRWCRFRGDLRDNRKIVIGGGGKKGAAKNEGKGTKDGLKDVGEGSGLKKEIKTEEDEAVDYSAEDA